MVDPSAFNTNREISWCPGCGNHLILDVVKQTLADMGYLPHQVLLVSGIGQAAKMSQYIRANVFNVLHGRTLPTATGASLVNPDLETIAIGGDGDGYSEGGNHLIHAARRNVDIIYLVHNNQIYGLTKGQLSPTTDLGSPTTSYPDGNTILPLNPVRLMLGAGSSFVARAFAGDKEQLSAILQQALQHRGFASVDILQPCVVFNPVNTYRWYKERVYDINKEGHRTDDMASAFQLAGEWEEKIPTGVFYAVERATLNDARGASDTTPMVDREPDPGRVAPLLDKYVL